MRLLQREYDLYKRRLSAQAPQCHLKMLKQSLIVFALAVPLLYACACVYALLIADKLIYPVPPVNYQPDEFTFELPSSDGNTIHASAHLPPDQSEVLLYCHGNGTDLGHLQPLFADFRARGLAYLAFDYPGYGLSSGKPSEAGCYAAAETAYHYLTKTKGIQPKQIILYGRSLGGGSACWLAVRKPIGGLILDGTFTSTFRVMTQRRILPFDQFDNLAKLPQVTSPVLLLHGMRDRTVPFSHALRNHAAIRAPKAQLWIEGAGHNDLIEVAGEHYWSTLLNFIQNPSKFCQ